MTIGIEKILTISAKEWFEITGKNPNEYEAQGVHYDCMHSFPEDVLKKTPSEVEVVVGCRLTPNICGSGENNSMGVVQRYIQ